MRSSVGLIMDYDKFTYWKTQYLLGCETVLHNWHIRNKATGNGIHFHGRTLPDSLRREEFMWCNRYGFTASGIERHSATGEGTPDHEHCPVTGGKCWHDGSSLAAQEQLGHINPTRDDGEIWFVLHQWYKSQFGFDGSEMGVE